MRPLIFLAVCIFLASCSSNNCSDLTQQITLPNNDILMVSECHTLENQQGIDSQVGMISNETDDVTFHFDIGTLAGHYVDTTDVNSVKTQSVNEPFWYANLNNCNIDTGNDCYYVSFTNRGPANFIIPDAGNWDAILEILKTYESQ